MEFQEIKNKDRWEKFVASFKVAQFLQSWQWGEFQEKLGRKIFRFAVLANDQELVRTENQNNILGIAQLIKMPLPFGKSYFYCPRGPIFKENNQETIKKFFEKIKETAQREKIIFLRFEPLSNDFLSKAHGLGSKVVAVKSVQPSKTLLLDLTKTEEEILKTMHYKTRYNIRLAQRKGVVVRQGENEKDTEAFIRLTFETAERDKFKSHSVNHYRKLLNSDQDFVKLFLAEYEKKPLAANLMIFFGDTCTYSHGASSNQHKNLMAPHLLHWHCLSQAKKMGYKYYDFGGADEKKWPGVTRFKKGFVNQKTSIEISYPGTFDLPLNKKWYSLYSLAKKIL